MIYIENSTYYDNFLSIPLQTELSKGSRPQGVRLTLERRFFWRRYEIQCNWAFVEDETTIAIDFKLSQPVELGEYKYILEDERGIISEGVARVIKPNDRPV